MRGLNSLPSKRLIISYIFDWISIAIIAAIAAAFNAAGPYHRPFTLVDLSISFPYIDEQIPAWLLVVVSLFAPAIIIFLIALILVPGPTARPDTPKSLIWRRKLWEWNTGWLGLALSYAIAFFFTQGIKNLTGKPRPNMLARCNPNIGALAQHTVSNFAAGFDPEWTLVEYTICEQTDRDLLDDGFRSFPSGHSSMSFAGLTYLAFFLCSKFAIAIPFLASRSFSQDDQSLALERRQTLSSVLPVHHQDSHRTDETWADSPSSSTVPIRNRAAAPPVFLLALPLVPISVAFYITLTRYFQYYHHGFDVIVGSLIGILSAWFGFRWYHLPVRQGAGWSWGARTRDRAFGIGLGRGTYVGPEGWGSKKRTQAIGKDQLGHPTNGVEMNHNAYAPPATAV